MKNEYDKKAKPRADYLDDARDVKSPSKMPVETEKTMGEERMRTKLRYKTTPAQKARNRQGREYM